MRLRMFVALASFLMLGGAQMLRAQTQHEQPGENFPAEQNFTVTSDVTYTQGALGPLKADVYIPKGTGPFPGIVFIHGGGWKNGDRNQMIKLIKALAEDGYVGFTIEYDVDPVHFPASFHESLAAVKFFREHAAEYRLDPKRVGVAGSSAGGELAALVALDPEGAAFDNAASAQDLKLGSDDARAGGGDSEWSAGPDFAERQFHIGGRLPGREVRGSAAGVQGCFAAVSCACRGAFVLCGARDGGSERAVCGGGCIYRCAEGCECAGTVFSGGGREAYLLGGSAVLCGESGGDQEVSRSAFEEKSNGDR